jgi:hypothetical protein
MFGLQDVNFFAQNGVMPKALLLLSLGFSLALPSYAGESPASAKGTPAGTWKGKLHFESQDSYRGNNAKGAHRSGDTVWSFEISPDGKTIAYYQADWKGPKLQAKLVHKDNPTITWHESQEQSAELKPKTFYNAQGQRIGTGFGITPDVDADWTIHLLPDGTALVHCSMNREDIYARITDTTVTGTLARVR